MFKEVQKISGVKRVNCYLHENHEELDEFPSVIIEESMISNRFSIRFLEGNRAYICVNNINIALKIAELYILDLKECSPHGDEPY